MSDVELASAALKLHREASRHSERYRRALDAGIWVLDGKRQSRAGMIGPQLGFFRKALCLVIVKAVRMNQQFGLDVGSVFAGDREARGAKILEPQLRDPWVNRMRA